MVIANTKIIAILAFVGSVLIIATDAFSVGPSASSSPNNSGKSYKRPPPLPKTQNAYTLLGFDWLSPPDDFDLVHRAYRQMARV